MLPDILSNRILICSAVYLVILFVVLVFLIRGVNRKRQVLSEETLSQNKYPYPQREAVAGTLLLPDQLSGAEMDAAVGSAYGDWLNRFMLPDLEAGRAFLSGGVGNHWLKHQIRASSFGQGLAMLISVLMGGNDLGAQSRFDRLLAFALAHPSIDSPSLMTRRTMPDLSAYKKFPADLNSELWISFSLMAALEQWCSSDRFLYPALIRERLDAVLEVYATQNPEEQSELLFSPYFFHRFKDATAKDAWLNLDRALVQKAKTALTDSGAALTGSGEAEESQLGLTLLQIGLAGLWEGEESWKAWEPTLGPVLREACQRLPQAIGTEDAADLTTSLSATALLAACVPGVMCLKDQPLINQLWDSLVELKVPKNDPFGATLRLLGLLLLSGNAWFSQLSWEALPLPVILE